MKTEEKRRELENNTEESDNTSLRGLGTNRTAHVFFPCEVSSHLSPVNSEAWSQGLLKVGPQASSLQVVYS